MKLHILSSLSTVACGALFLSPSTLLAQNAPPAPASSPASSPAPSIAPAPQGEHEHPMAKFLESLGLTDEQKEKLKPLVEDAKTKLAAIRNDESLSGQQKIDQVKALWESVSPQTKDILTPDQMQKIQQGIEQLKNRVDHSLETFFGNLGLTEEQKESLKPILQDARTKFTAIRDNSELTGEQKFEQVKALWDSVSPQVKGILSPEQLAKVEQAVEHFKDQHGHQPASAPSPQQ